MKVAMKKPKRKPLFPATDTTMSPAPAQQSDDMSQTFAGIEGDDSLDTQQKRRAKAKAYLNMRGNPS